AKTTALQTTLNASNKDWDVILRLITEGADVNAKSNTGNTALILAATFGRTATVTALLGVSGINVNIQNDFGNTALIWAAMFGHTAVVNALLENPGINVNIKESSGNTALIWAAFNGRTNIVTALLEVSDINVNIQNSSDKTALDAANTLAADNANKTAIINALKSKGGKTGEQIASDGHETMGGYDIFISELDPETLTWSAPENLGFPINSPDDELHFKLNSDLVSGYFTSNRLNTIGDYDIFFFWEIHTVKIKGRVIEGTTGAPITNARIFFRPLAYTDLYYFSILDEEGQYQTSVTAEDVFKVEIKKDDGTVTALEQFEIHATGGTNTTYIKDFFVRPSDSH
ncbi:MAG: ankyrin repeat domain-containing protein, partial [Ekhidna sp.]|nr:ankyrin repeat domain-containing protein [Ekhidna sp.]